ncbi:UNVERIFIED_CONTAM: hypothetical protein FKN15_065988 [Acipenser sinensis]
MEASARLELQSALEAELRAKQNLQGELNTARAASIDTEGDPQFSVSSVFASDVIHANKKDVPCIFRVSQRGERLPRSEPGIRSESIHPLRIHPSAQNPSICSESIHLLRIHPSAQNPSAQNPSIRSESIHPLRIHPPAQNPSTRSESIHPLRIHPPAQNPSTRSESIHPLRIHPPAQNPSTRSESIHPLRIHPPAQNPSTRSESIHPLRIHPPAQNPSTRSESIHPLRIHPPAQNQNASIRSESIHPLRIHPSAQNPSIRSESSHPLRIHPSAQNPSIRSESIHPLRIHPPAQNPSIRSESTHPLRIHPSAQNPSVPRPAGVKKGWQRAFAVVSDFKLFLFDLQESRAAQPSNGASQVIDMRDPQFSVSSVFASDVIHANKKDVPCIFRVTASQLSAPSTKLSVLLLADSESEKGRWEAVLNELHRLLVKHQLPDRSVYLPKEAYDSALPLIRNAQSAAIVDHERIALGTEEGLYLIQVTNNVILQLGDCKKVTQMQVVPEARVLAVVSGRNRSLRLYSWEDLQNPECSGTKIQESRGVQALGSGRLCGGGQPCLYIGIKRQVSCYSLTPGKSGYQKLCEFQAPGSVQWLGVFGERVCVGYPGGFTLYPVGSESGGAEGDPPVFLLSPDDPSLQFLSQPPLVDALCAVEIARDELLLCFSCLGVYVDCQGRRTRGRELMNMLRDPSMRSKLISNPTNFSHLVHVGPGVGVPGLKGDPRDPSDSSVTPMSRPRSATESGRPLSAESERYMKELHGKSEVSLSLSLSQEHAPGPLHAFQAHLEPHQLQSPGSRGAGGGGARPEGRPP